MTTIGVMSQCLFPLIVQSDSRSSPPGSPSSLSGVCSCSPSRSMPFPARSPVCLIPVLISSPPD